MSGVRLDHATAEPPVLDGRRPPVDISGWTAEGLMSRVPVAVQPHESVASAWELIERGGFRHLPVVGSDGRCLSLIDDRIVVRALVVAGLGTPRVADVMPRRVHCVLPSTPVRGVARVMATEHATAVPVVDAGGRLVGIVTDSDIVALVAAAD